MKKTINIALFSVLGLSLAAQQLSPLELIASPIVNQFVLSGIGGGNLQELNFATGASSAQFALDWNIANLYGKETKKGKQRLFTHTALIKVNPILSTRLIKKDSIPARKLAIVDNEHMFQFGYRFRSLTELSTSTAYKRYAGNSNADFLQSAYVDLMYTPYTIAFADTLKGKFQTINLNTGYQLGFLKSQTIIGNIAISLSGQANLLGIIEESENKGDFDKTYKSLVKLPRTYLGLGGKLLFQLNDFAIHLEVRRYISIGNKNTVEGLNDNLIVSFGFAATGTAFNIGHKEEGNRW